MSDSQNWGRRYFSIFLFSDLALLTVEEIKEILQKLCNKGHLEIQITLKEKTKKFDRSNSTVYKCLECQTTNVALTEFGKPRMAYNYFEINHQNRLTECRLSSSFYHTFFITPLGFITFMNFHFLSFNIYLIQSHIKRLIICNKMLKLPLWFLSFKSSFKSLQIKTSLHQIDKVYAFSTLSCCAQV